MVPPWKMQIIPVLLCLMGIPHVISKTQPRIRINVNLQVAGHNIKHANPTTYPNGTSGTISELINGPVGPADEPTESNYRFTEPYINQIWGIQCGTIEKLSLNLEDCMNACVYINNCTAIEYTAIGGTCNLKACTLPVPFPTSTDSNYNGYALISKFEGPNVQIWTEEECTSSPVSYGGSIANCMIQALQTGNNAIYYYYSSALGYTACVYLYCTLQKPPRPAPQNADVIPRPQIPQTNSDDVYQGYSLIYETRFTNAYEGNMVWDAPKCKLLDNSLKKSVPNLFECMAACIQTFSCDALNYNSENPDCVLWDCRLPVGEPNSYEPPYEAYSLIILPCASDEFDCLNGECYPGIAKCDGISDCSNNLDEEYCYWTYDRNNKVYGPAYWKNLGGTPPQQCNIVDKQAPIDITDSVVTAHQLGTIDFSSYESTPIDSTLGIAEFYPAFSFSVDQGKYSNMTLSGGGIITEATFFGGVLHWGSDNSVGSDHQIESKSYSMELQLVHRSIQPGDGPKNRSAILCILYEVSSDDNPVLKPIIDAAKDLVGQGMFDGPFNKIWSDSQCPVIKSYLKKSLSECETLCTNTEGCTAINFSDSPPGTGQGIDGCVLRNCTIPIPEPSWDYPPYKGYAKGDRGFLETPLNNLNVSSLLPSNTDDFYRYDGSLTFPPCGVGIQYTVFKTTSHISESQLNVLRDIKLKGKSISNNYRPIQNLGGRKVIRNST